MSESKVMQIQVLSATPKQLPAKTPGKTYSALELAFKNLTFQGKVEGKNLVGFGNGKAAYDALLNAQPGEVYNVDLIKDGAYWNWIKAVKAEGGAAAPNVSTPTTTYNKPGAPATASPKSTYETPEERAKKQVYIVRQSSLSNAIDLLSVGSKSSPDVDKVLEIASRFESFVFGDSTKPADEVGSSFFPNTKPTTNFDDLDDIPL